MTREALGYALAGRPTRVLVSAHLDTAEAVEFSEELAARRAQAVASELVAGGIDPSLIVFNVRRDEQLARATAPNVREPLNRRALVDINF